MAVAARCTHPRRRSRRRKRLSRRNALRPPRRAHGRGRAAGGGPAGPRGPPPCWPRGRQRSTRRRWDGSATRKTLAARPRRVTCAAGMRPGFDVLCSGERTRDLPSHSIQSMAHAPPALSDRRCTREFTPVLGEQAPALFHEVAAYLNRTGCWHKLVEAVPGPEPTWGKLFRDRPVPNRALRRDPLAVMWSRWLSLCPGGRRSGGGGCEHPARDHDHGRGAAGRGVQQPQGLPGSGVRHRLRGARRQLRSIRRRLLDDDVGPVGARSDPGWWTSPGSTRPRSLTQRHPHRGRGGEPYGRRDRCRRGGARPGVAGQRDGRAVLEGAARRLPRPRREGGQGQSDADRLTRRRAEIRNDGGDVNRHPEPDQQAEGELQTLRLQPPPPG